MQLGICGFRLAICREICDGRDGCCGGGISYGSDEAIAATSESFDEARIIGGVAQGFADLVDSGAEGVVEIDDCVLAPETELEVLAGDDLAWVFEQSGENLEGLALDLDPFARLPEFASLEIGFKESEGDSGWTLDERRHQLLPR